MDVPNQFIDDYDLHLKRGSKDEIDGYVHVTGATSGESVTVRIPEANLVQQSTTDSSGRAQFTLHASGLKLWSPNQPKLYSVAMQAGEDQ